MPSFLHSGDAGDAIYALPVIKSLGGGSIYFDSRPWTRSRFTPDLIGALEGLFLAQEFVDEVALHRGQKIDYDLSTFRNGGYKLGDTIMERQRRWLNAPKPDISKPWLTLPPTFIKDAARIVINRAPRWIGFHFPWLSVADNFREHAVFIGLPEEHKEFCKAFGKVEYRHTPTLLDAAQLINGSELFIGNQSACNAIANGLHQKTLLEVCPYAPDCFYPRDNVCFSCDGSVKLHLSGRDYERPPYHPKSGWYIDVAGKRIFSDSQIHAHILGKAELAFRGLPYEEDLTPVRYREEYAAAA